MSSINNYKFSKIGTNPQKYLDNFFYHLNNIPIGDELKIKNYNVYHEDVSIFSANSDATFRQNVDTWLWMGFVVRKNKNTLVKIIEELNKEELMNYSSKMLLLDSKDKMIDQHRKTIIIKLLTLNQKNSVHNGYSYEEIIKECGRYEENILKNKEIMNMLIMKWGK